ncbi:hypothetical protein BH11BAC6_BH11BAC6_02220 [soil metagenome]
MKYSFAMFKFTCFMLVFLWLHNVAVAQETIYPAPAGLAASADYSVLVNGKPAFVYASPVPAAYCSFDMSASVDITIKANRDIKWVDVRPLSAHVTPKFKDSTINIHLDKPCKLSIELNGSIKTPLFIFAIAPEKNKPSKNDKNVIFFEAGKVHYAGIIQVQSNQTVYVEAGAVVVGVIKADHAKHIRIAGRGILDGSYNNRFDEALIKSQSLQNLPQPSENTYQRSIELNNCEDISIEDITLHNSTSWQVVPVQCSNVHINNIKVVSDQPSDDGIDVVHCKNVLIENSFFRTKDDCVVIKSYLNDSTVKGTDSVLVRNCVFWNALWGNALEIGFELNSAEVKNITFRNNDIIHVESGAVISIHNAGKAVVSNVLFDDIRIEDARQKLFDFAIFRSRYSNDGTDDEAERKRLYLNGAWDGVLMVPADEKAYHANFRGKITNITLRNINIVDGLFPFSIFYGFDSVHNVSNVKIENLTVHGKKITLLKDAKIYLENTNHISIK